MSFSRSITIKSNGTSTVPPRLPKSTLESQTKKSPEIFKAPSAKLDEFKLASPPDRDELNEIVNNLSNIVKKSEQLLTPVKPSVISTNIQRSGSLHLTKVELDRRKLINDSGKSLTSKTMNNGKLTDPRSKHHESMSDRSSECNTTVSSISRRTSIRPVQQTEKYSGIKCTLPAFRATVPHGFKGLEKHCTPTRPKLSSNTSVFMQSQFTPTTNSNSKTREKSPWRLRFEKFLNHQEPTPLSPTRESVTADTTKNSLLGKENRTPSFRLPARRMSRCNLPS